jgi:Ran GTPase-activating protein (RanGAP) involved in mRNA processing and transport
VSHPRAPPLLLPLLIHTPASVLLQQPASRFVGVNIQANKLNQRSVEMIGKAVNGMGTVGGLSKEMVVTSVCLCGNGLGEAAMRLLPAVRTGKNLHTLKLECNGIGDKFVNEFATILAQNTSLQRVSLSGNHITDVGMRELAIALHSNCTLCQLDVAYNGVAVKGAEAIAEVRSSIRYPWGNPHRQSANRLRISISSPWLPSSP